MIKKIKQFILIAMASVPLLTASLATGVVSAVAPDNIINGVCQGTNNAANGSDSTSCGNAGNGSNNADLKSLAGKIVSIFSIIVGIVAVIMIIYGGFRYITSGGDSGKVGGAKNALIYAIIGLVIVALAQFIVHYVLNTATNSVTTS